MKSKKRLLKKIRLNLKKNNLSYQASSLPVRQRNFYFQKVFEIFSDVSKNKDSSEMYFDLENTPSAELPSAIADCLETALKEIPSCKYSV